ncbi:hypothetical protein CKO28_03330 [Rhodovibrio sodomensis]|uniref:DUF3179 domain-containing protein n=2 Tax=Rhodovibrio sodomensis TaxID=1088 RepID=A0ABS1D9K2_9PROT|nr:hypothetical protein [Rhodovibrio sodomensis]
MFVAVLAIALALAAAEPVNAQVPQSWRSAFPETDFSRHAVPFDEIMSGGVPKDGIPSIDEPEFAPVAERRDWLADREPVIGLEINGDARAYPLRVLTWHEIVNDTVGGVPVAVTYCPLCNTAIVFEAKLDGRRLTFGTTGKLRHSDLVMYDRQTGTWWQQFTGRGIVGEHTGEKLEFVPARLESWGAFVERHPDARVLIPTDPNARPYGKNPYAGYDSARSPFLYRGPMPEKLPAMARVVVIGEDAWALELLRETGRIETDTHVLTWSPGQASALDARRIAEGRDVGTVTVQKKTPDGLQDAVYDVTFAFVHKAFHPDGSLHVGDEGGGD